jgi:hypothetical protein
MIWFALAGACEKALPRGREAVVNLVLENRTDLISAGGRRCFG